MPDNLKYNEPGSGPNVATDLIETGSGTGHVQWFKLDVGPPNETIPVTGSTFGVPVDVKRIVGGVVVSGSVAVTQSTSPWIISGGVALGAPIPPGSNEIGSVRVAAISGVVSDINSSTSTLGVTGTFTGTAQDCLNYSAVTVNILVDQPSDLTEGLKVQWSSNATNWDYSDQVTLGGSGFRSLSLRPKARYFRVVYKNGLVAQGAMRLQTILHPVAPRQELISRAVVVTPTLSLTAYANGDNMGGVQVIRDLVPPGRRSMVLQSLVLTDKDEEGDRIDVIFFSANPSSSTLTDNAAADINDADITKILGGIRIEPSEYFDLGNSSVATKQNIGLVLIPDSPDLWFTIITRQAGTWTAVDDLSFRFIFLPGES